MARAAGAALLLIYDRRMLFQSEIVVAEECLLAGARPRVQESQCVIYMNETV